MDDEITDGVIADAIRMVELKEALPPYVDPQLMSETAATLTAWSFTEFEEASEAASSRGEELSDEHLSELINRAICAAYIVGRIDDAIRQAVPAETIEATGSKSGATYIINNYFN